MTNEQQEAKNYGYENFDSTKSFYETFTDIKDITFQTFGYYVHAGWLQAEKEAIKAEKEAVELAKLVEETICPICSGNMTNFHSGYYCDDTKECKYHEHRS